MKSFLYMLKHNTLTILNVIKNSLKSLPDANTIYSRNFLTYFYGLILYNKKKKTNRTSPRIRLDLYTRGRLEMENRLFWRYSYIFKLRGPMRGILRGPLNMALSVLFVIDLTVLLTDDKADSGTILVGFSIRLAKAKGILFASCSLGVYAMAMGASVPLLYAELMILGDMKDSDGSTKLISGFSIG
ncbi:hypothetical protein GQX74_014347 [Glossina fuscipes]|nr:hypothetical protein GQX74_014347 [Glossina fuscipes]